jgi:phosphoglucosamine mutase
MKYFGTDGIRGRAYDFITEELALRVGQSMFHFREKTNKVIICRDTRESGEMIVNQLTKGILEAGIDVLDIGILATPILAFATIKNDCFGIMVTASHNPYYDNGIKIFNRGEKLLLEAEDLIENTIDKGIDIKTESIGFRTENIEILEDYYALFKPFASKLKLNVIFDLANGATIKSAKSILPSFVDGYEFIGDQANGRNINDNCGSTHLELLQEKVKVNHYDLGIAFDGDGDRILTVDDKGEVVDGDLLIYLFAKYLKDKKLLNNDVVVLSKMSNLGIIRGLENIGIRVIQTEVGDKYIFRALDQENATLGGENSGHIINRYILGSGDGVLNAWFLLMVLNHYGKKLSDLKQEVKYYPDKLVNIKNINKDLAKHQEVIDLVNYYRELLGNEGKVLVRPSGTEPLIRVSVSAKDQITVDEIINKLIEKINSLKEGV